ncbi:hypothetical protein X975_15445, partial [Stegodyphus mimosarum]
MLKGKCTYKEDYLKECKFIRKGRHVEEVECTVCISFISIRLGGRADIKDHLAYRVEKAYLQHINCKF